MEEILSMLGVFKDKYLSWMDLPVMTVIDIVEIVIIAFLFYTILLWIKNTRAWMLLKGLLVILVFVMVAAVFQMTTILWLAEKTLNVGVIALVIIFQPELRKALEQLGRKSFLKGVAFLDFGKDQIEHVSEKAINELVRACFEMGKVKTGALIVMEDTVNLSEYERTGIAVDAILTNQLLINIFEKIRRCMMAQLLCVETVLFLRLVTFRCRIIWNLARSLAQGIGRLWALVS